MSDAAPCRARDTADTVRLGVGHHYVVISQFRNSFPAARARLLTAAGRHSSAEPPDEKWACKTPTPLGWSHLR